MEDYTFADYDEAREKYGKRELYDKMYDETCGEALYHLNVGSFHRVTPKASMNARMADKYFTSRDRRRMMNATSKVSNAGYIDKETDTLFRLRAKLEARKKN
jgi:hypothetical protein